MSGKKKRKSDLSRCKLTNLSVFFFFVGVSDSYGMSRLFEKCTRCAHILSEHTLALCSVRV